MICHITNVVCMAELNCNVDLKGLSRVLGNVEYKPNRFSALIWNHKRIRVKCLLFKNGKIIVMGCVSFQHARNAIRQYGRLLGKAGYKVKLNKNRLLTMSASAKLGTSIDLNKVACCFKACYEPELFPGVLLKKTELNFTIYSTGAVIITGLKSIKDMERKVYPKLLEIILCA